MQRNINRTGLVNMLILLLAVVVCFIMARTSGLLAGQVSSIILGIGFLVASLSYIQMRLEERERLERLEIEELARSKGGAALFERTDEELLVAKKSREQFEKYFVPGFTILLMLIEGISCVYLYKWLGSVVVARSQILVSLGIYGLVGLVLFIIGKYSANLVRLEQHRLLSPQSNHLLLGAYLLGLNIVSIVAIEAGFENADLLLARILTALLGLLAIENLLTLLLEIYRPRVPGAVARLLYESRLVGLLSKPEGVLATAAHALDYQFGFKVSETWVYKFFRNALPQLLLAQLLAIELSTCIVVVEVGEKGLWERFGKPVGDGIVEPGIHFKLPFPIDTIRRFRTEQIQTFIAGMEHKEEGEKGEKKHAHKKVLLWTVQHTTKDPFLLLVASREESSQTPETGRRSPPVNLLAASIPVQFQVIDLYAWAYNHSDPENLLKHIATRELVQFLLSADYDEILSRKRLEASEVLKERIQKRVDELKLGVKIIHLGMNDLHPPVPIASAYEQVVSSKQKQEATILAAKSHSIQTNAMALAEAVKKTNNAVAVSHRLQEISRAQSIAFTNRLAAYLSAPEVYKQRAYLEALVRGSEKARKYIFVSTNARDVIQYNLEENIRPELLESAARALK
ncbi:MAG: SPFH domain-containing protein [Limisphaerales bacterium]